MQIDVKGLVPGWAKAKGKRCIQAAPGYKKESHAFEDGARKDESACDMCWFAAMTCNLPYRYTFIP